jgi:hypothetical protein
MSIKEDAMQRRFKIYLFYNAWIVVLMFLPSALLAEIEVAENEESCLEQFQSYGDGKGLSYIQEECVEAYRLAAAMPALAGSLDDKTLLFAYQNGIVHYEMDSEWRKSQYFFAGESTQLSQIVALKRSPDQEEITVLDSKEGKLLTFKLNISGNVAPDPVIHSPHLKNTVDFSLNLHEQRVIVVDENKKSIEFFKVLDSEARSGPGRVLEKDDSIRGSQTRLEQPVAIELDRERSMIYVADRAKKELLVFSLNDRGNVAPVEVISSVDMSGETPLGLEYFQAEKRLRVRTESGKKVLIQR